MPNCFVNDAPSEEFCSRQSGGITCAALGNPVCQGMSGSPAPLPQEQGGAPTSTFPTPSPSEGSSTNLLEIVLPSVVGGLFGLVIAWVQKDNIVNVYHRVVPAR
jgi:hypothetical protein